MAETAADTSDKAAPKKKRVLTPEEKAQKASRRACKVEICKALAGEVPAEGTIACDIVKTWREADIEDMVDDRITWSWGKAVCQSKLRVKRKELRDAMTKPDHTVALSEQTVTCRLDRKGEEDPYKVVVNLAPEVTFEHGEAIEARLNWGDADAPLAIYPLIYSGTGLDNQTNILGSEVVKLVNQFTTRKCTEVGMKLDIAPDTGRDGPAEDPEGGDDPAERRAALN